MTPEQRSMRARIASHERWAACEDRTAAMSPQRKAWEDSFEKKADPDGVLSPQERAKRAEHLRQAHYARMRLASLKSRARKKARKTAEPPGDTAA